MPYSIQFQPAALRDLESLPQAVRTRIRRKIDDLAENPLPIGVKKLAGSGLFRIRVGDYRVIYSVEHGRLLVIVIHVGHRREIYR